MRWQDERYVRLYTRDTTDWRMLSWQAQGLFCLILSKVDRAGILDLGRHGKRGITAHIGRAEDWPVIEPLFDELLVDGCIEMRGNLLVIPNFLEAQESSQSDAARARAHRERARDLARGKAVIGQTFESQNVTPASRAVTSASQPVTPSLAVPCRSDPDPPPICSATISVGDHTKGVVGGAGAPPGPPLLPPKAGTQMTLVQDEQQPSRRARATKKAQGNSVELPSWLPAEAWAAWEEFRRSKAPLTEHARRLCISKLDELRQQGHDLAAVIDQSILHGWRGLFPIKAEGRRQQEGLANVSPEQLKRYEEAF